MGSTAPSPRRTGRCLPLPRDWHGLGVSAGAEHTQHPGPHRLKGVPGLPPRVLLPKEPGSPSPLQAALTAQPLPGPDAKSPSTYARRNFFTISPHFSQEYLCTSVQILLF